MNLESYIHISRTTIEFAKKFQIQFLISDISSYKSNIYEMHDFITNEFQPKMKDAGLKKIVNLLDTNAMVNFAVETNLELNRVNRPYEVRSFKTLEDGISWLNETD